MPEISRFYGIIIRMYSGDHPPPHFHAIYGEHEAFVEIETGGILFGSIPGTALRLVQLWTDRQAMIFFDYMLLSTLIQEAQL